MEHTNQCSKPSNESSKSTKKPTNSSSTLINKRGYIVIPYTKALSESIKHVCRKHGIQVYFKGAKYSDLLVAPKDKDPITKKYNIIYRFKYDRVECNEEYTGESSRTFGERLKEHLKFPSQVYDHYNTTGHTTTLEIFSIVGSRGPEPYEAYKRNIYLRVNSPSLNKNIGKYHLPYIWDEVLFNISELKIK